MAVGRGVLRHVAGLKCRGRGDEKEEGDSHCHDNLVRRDSCSLCGPAQTYTNYRRANSLCCRYPTRCVERRARLGGAASVQARATWTVPTFMAARSNARPLRKLEERLICDSWSRIVEFVRRCDLQTRGACDRYEFAAGIQFALPTINREAAAALFDKLDSHNARTLGFADIGQRMKDRLDPPPPPKKPEPPPPIDAAPTATTILPVIVPAYSLHRERQRWPPRKPIPAPPKRDVLPALPQATAQFPPVPPEDFGRSARPDGVEVAPKSGLDGMDGPPVRGVLSSSSSSSASNGRPSSSSSSSASSVAEELPPAEEEPPQPVVRTRQMQYQQQRAMPINANGPPVPPVDETRQLIMMARRGAAEEVYDAIDHFERRHNPNKVRAPAGRQVAWPQGPAWCDRPLLLNVPASPELHARRLRSRAGGRAQRERMAMHRARLQQAPARQRVLMPPEQHQQVFRVSRSSPTPDETGRRERPFFA